jgi:formylglycine-generating enzyme required for sulfatase activity
MGFSQLLVQSALASRALVLAVVFIEITGLFGAARADASKPERWLALVIGIDAYQNAPKLNNPINDAKAISAALRSLKFEVTEVFDPDLHQMSEAVREFGIKIQDADAAVVYYAGHGVQVEHENYLVPADARLERERDLVYEALPLSLVLEEVSQARRIGIVLLDSCRNNPFVERMARSLRDSDGNRIRFGLARVDSVPRNTLVAMSTRADEVAEDGAEHSPFAAALVKQLAQPGLELSLFFRNVRDSVLAATGNHQEPYTFSSLGAEPFFFHPRPPSRPPEIGAIAPLQVADNAGPTPLGIPAPTDSDQNPLTVRVLGLPFGGDVQIDGRPAAKNAPVPVDRFMTATYKPDGKTLGPVGALDFLVEDGLGGSVAASLPIIVVPSHHPAVVEAPRTFRAHAASLGIAPPTSPDGDQLAVVVRSLPRGIVRNGDTVLRVGDRLRPEDLPRLTYMPEAAYSGSAGILLYAVDNGRGDVVEGRVDIEVETTPELAERVALSGLFENLRKQGSAADLQAFLRLFPASRFAEDARKLLGERGASLPPAPVATAPPSAKPEPAPAPPRAEVANAAMPALPAPTSKPEALRVIAPSPAPALPAAAHEELEFRDCRTCVPMVRIPGGVFVIGEGARDPEALPAHKVAIRPFAIGRYPVTIGEWKACVAGGGCNPVTQSSTDEDAPVHNVSWDDAQQFLAWLSRLSGKQYRLPSEAEWEFAARGGTSSRYWWGESAGIGLANCADCGGTQNPHAPLPVNLFKPNPFGLVDALGGIAQWTADCWFPNYQGAPADGRPREGKACDKRVLRGGSFRATHDAIAATARNNYDQSVRYPLNGFRVARDLE